MFRRRSLGFALPCNSIVTTHLAVMYPHYVEYHIERGLEWIRIYTPGPWQPVATATLGRAPDHASTYREWRKSYHFDVCLVTDSTGGTTADPNVRPISYVSYHVWEFRDWNTRGYQRLGIPRPTIESTELVNEEITSSSVSSVPDGAWREPSPPPSYDPNFDWNESN